MTCGDSRAVPNHHRSHSYGYDTDLNEVAPGNHPAELLQDSDKPRYLLTVKERLTHAVTHNLTGKEGEDRRQKGTIIQVEKGKENRNV